MNVVVLTCFSLDGPQTTEPHGSCVSMMCPQYNHSMEHCSENCLLNFLDILLGFQPDSCHFFYFAAVDDCESFLSSAVLVGKCRAYARCQFDLRGRRSVPGAPPSHHSLPGRSQSSFQPQLNVYNPQTLTFQ